VSEVLGLGDPEAKIVGTLTGKQLVSATESAIRELFRAGGLSPTCREATEVVDAVQSQEWRFPGAVVERGSDSPAPPSVVAKDASSRSLGRVGSGDRIASGIAEISSGGGGGGASGGSGGGASAGAGEISSGVVGVDMESLFGQVRRWLDGWSLVFEALHSRVRVSADVWCDWAVVTVVRTGGVVEVGH
jgi:hypothetical protein